MGKLVGGKALDFYLGGTFFESRPR